MNQNIILDQMDYTCGKDCQQHTTKDTSWHSLAGRPLADHEGPQKTMVAQRQLKTLTSRGQNLAWAPTDTALGGITNL